MAATVTSGFTLASSNCRSSLGVGDSCQLGITFSPSAAGTVTGTLTVNASNLAAPLTVALSGAGDDFTIAVSGASSAIIASGQTAAFALHLEGLGTTSGTVAIACTGAPQYSTCSLNPNSAAISSLNSSSVTATIATGVSTTTAALHRGTVPHGLNWKTALAALALPLPLWLAGLRRGSRGCRTAIFVAVAVLLLAGCGVTASSGSGSGSGGGGGGGGGQNITPSGTYTLTITGTISNITHSVQVSVTVQ
jgi:hypothetical protein